MAATHRAFRNRRSLLLLNLERQVGFHELPWVQAVAGRHRDTGGVARTASRQALRNLAAYALDAFPGTIVPNPLVRELDTLARNAGLSVPFVEELAADIFMGTFTPKFAQAAALAGELLAGTLYELLGRFDEELSHRPAHVAVRLTPALDGLRHVTGGGTFDDPYVPAHARRFLGWTSAGHWMLEASLGEGLS